MRARERKRDDATSIAQKRRASPQVPPDKALVRWAKPPRTDAWHDDWGIESDPEADDEPLFDEDELRRVEAMDASEQENSDDGEDDDETDDEGGEGSMMDEDAPHVRATRSPLGDNGNNMHDDVEDEAASSDDDRRRGRRRSKTIARKQMLRERRRMLAQGSVPEIVDYERPMSRAACREGARPCLFVSCRYHLYLDVNSTTGSIKLNFPDKEVWDLEETCALDVAERGGITLEEVGEIMNLTRERIRQVEVSGLEKLRTGDAALHTFIDGREFDSPPSIVPAPK